MTSPQKLLTIMSRMMPNMAQLIGNQAWAEIKDDFNSHLQQLSESQDDLSAMRSALALQKIISRFLPARERLLLETTLEDIFEQVRPEIIQLAPHTQTDPLFLAVSRAFTWGGSLDEFYARDISLSTSPDLKATSVKSGNLRLDPGQLFEVGATTALNVVGVATLNPILIALCTLLTARWIKKAMTIELTQNEASVYLGMIESLKENSKAGEADILLKTNRIRQQYGLTPLSLSQFNALAMRLEKLGSVELDEGIWRITEQFTMQN